MNTAIRKYYEADAGFSSGKVVEQKLSFPEFMAFTEFEKVDESGVYWAKNIIADCAIELFHNGDCTNQNHSCSLCVLENLLSDYFEYCKKNSFIKEGKAVGDAEIEKAAKEEAVRAVSEFYPFDRDENWYKHGLELAERMFKVGAGYKAALQSKHHELDLDLIKEYGYLEQHDVPMSKAALQSKVAEQIAAYVHEIDSLRETNRKLGDKIAELQKEIDEKNKEICDLLDWGNGKDDELDRLEKKITEIQNDFMQVQTNEQIARFDKEDKLNMGRVNP